MKPRTNYSPKPCQTCGEVFKPSTSRHRFCSNPCKPTYRYARPYLPKPKPLTTFQQTCGNCAHGYQFAPGEYGCAIQAAMRCKPALVSRQWMARQVVRTEASA